MTSENLYWDAAILAAILAVVLVLFVAYGGDFVGTSKLDNHSDYIYLQERLIEREEVNLQLHLNENVYLREELEYYYRQVDQLREELETPAEPSVLAAAPVNRLSESAVDVGRDRVVIRSSGAQKWFVYDTGSMLPIIDAGSTVLTQMPDSAEDVTVGDIIFFDAEWYDTAVVHRVVEIGSDSQGLYYWTKGDSSVARDPEPVHFGDVRGVVVGIIY